MKYEHTDTKDTGITRHYHLTFESDEKEVEVGVIVEEIEYQANINDIKFLTEISEEDKQEISDWIWDNLGEW